MTIDPHLRNQSLGEATPTSGPKRFIPLKTDPGHSFSEELASAVSTEPVKPNESIKGLTASDYLSKASSFAATSFFKNSTIHNGTRLSHGQDWFTDSLPYMKKNKSRSASMPQSPFKETDSCDPVSINVEAEIADSIKKAAAKYNIPEKLIKSVIRAESNFQVDAVSPAGAQGLMQLMPATARELGVNDPFDAAQNIDGGTRYLRKMLDRFGGDVRLALAAYNAGPGTVIKYNGNVPYRETQTYIQKIVKEISA